MIDPDFLAVLVFWHNPYALTILDLFAADDAEGACAGVYELSPENKAKRSLMKKRKKEFLERTKQMWQPHAHKPLSDEDVSQILENTIGFFRVLREWKKKENDPT